MTKITDLKGFCYPLTPTGRSSIVGEMPWHYGTEYYVVSYRVDVDELKKWLPEPLELGDEPDMAYVAFSKWWSVSEQALDMPVVSPSRTQYVEAAIWAGCSYNGIQGQICLPIWVSKDFSMARGWFMGFPKKYGEINITDFNALSPGMDELGIGSTIGATVSTHGEMLIKSTMKFDKLIEKEDLPKPLGRPLFHIRHFPSIVKDAKPSVLELVRLGAENWNWDKNVYAGTGTLEFLSSCVEEHMPLAPKEILGAYHYKNGYTFNGGEVLHDWTKEI